MGAGRRCANGPCGLAARGRRQMFLSGFVTDMAKIDAVLPDEVLSWMLDEGADPVSFAVCKPYRNLRDLQCAWKLRTSLRLHTLGFLGPCPSR